MEGLIAFGGCIPTIMGIMPVAKADPLLIGKQPGAVVFSTACPPSYRTPALGEGAAVAASSVILDTKTVAKADRLLIGKQPGAVVSSAACPTTRASYMILAIR